MMAQAKKKNRKARGKGSGSSTARTRTAEPETVEQETSTAPESAETVSETSASSVAEQKTDRKAEKKQARKALTEEEREEERLRRIAEEMTADLEDVSPTPIWYKALMMGFMIIGLLWIMTFYITQQAFPIPDVGFWNIGIGIGLMMIGLVMTTRWR